MSNQPQPNTPTSSTTIDDPYMLHVRLINALFATVTSICPSSGLSFNSLFPEPYSIVAVVVVCALCTVCLFQLRRKWRPKTREGSSSTESKVGSRPRRSMRGGFLSSLEVSFGDLELESESQAGGDSIHDSFDGLSEHQANGNSVRLSGRVEGSEIGSGCFGGVGKGAAIRRLSFEEGMGKPRGFGFEGGPPSFDGSFLEDNGSPLSEGACSPFGQRDLRPECAQFGASADQERSVSPADQASCKLNSSARGFCSPSPHFGFEVLVE